MNKAIFLDRDGTINIDYGYVYKIEDFHFIDGVVESLKQLNDLGYLLIVISNQSGVGRGYYTLEDTNKIFDYMVNSLKELGVTITKYYYCPHVDSDHCNCRKPKLGLFEQAIEKFDIDLEASYAIGDKIRDLAICDKYPVKGILLDKDNITYNYVVTKRNMIEALEYIKNLDGVKVYEK